MLEFGGFDVVGVVQCGFGWWLWWMLWMVYARLTCFSGGFGDMRLV